MFQTAGHCEQRTTKRLFATRNIAIVVLISLNDDDLLNSQNI